MCGATNDPENARDVPFALGWMFIRLLFDRFDPRPSGPSEWNSVPLFKPHPVPSGLALTCFGEVFMPNLKTPSTWKKYIYITRNIDPKAEGFLSSNLNHKCVRCCFLKLLKALRAFCEMFMINVPRNKDDEDTTLTYTIQSKRKFTNLELHWVCCNTLQI